MRIVNFILFCVVVSLFISVSSVSQAQVTRVDCRESEARMIRDNPNDTLEFQGIRLYSGSIEGTNHYDALVVAYQDGAGFRWCRRYESDLSTSTHAQQLDEWNGRFFVTLTVDEATSALEEVASGGWISSYGLGAGPVVGLILEIEPYVNGAVQRGTYVISKTEDGLTNSVVIYGVQYYDDVKRVHIDGIASSYVLDENGDPLNYVDCPRGSAFRYILDYDMSEIREVQCNGVTLRSDAVLQNTGEIAENLPESINPGGGFFSYCTTTGGILVMGVENGTGYELFGVSNAQIANSMLTAEDIGQNIKLGESGDVSLWALSDGENLQFSTPAPYTFIFNKYRCGDLFPTSDPLSVSTSDNFSVDSFTIQSAPQPTATPSAGTGLPVYRPSRLNLNEDGTYTIRAGDNLATIAAKLGVPQDVLAEHNGISNPRFIQIGQVLEIP